MPAVLGWVQGRTPASVPVGHSQQRRGDVRGGSFPSGFLLLRERGGVVGAGFDAAVMGASRGKQLGG